MKYSKQVSLGYDPGGRRVRKWVHADSKTELKRKETELLKDWEKNMLTPAVFGEYAELWFRTYKTNKATRTQDYYKEGLKKLESVSRMKLSQITRSHLQAIISENWEHARTCEKIHDTVNQIFKSAIADGLVWRNPAEGLSLPKRVVEEKRILTKREREIVKRIELPPAEKLFLELIRELALRPEEARALTRSQFNLSNRSVSITQAVIFDDNAPELKDTKNEKHRTLPLSDSIVERLRAYFKTVQVILFPNSRGEYMTKSSYRCFEKRIFKALSQKMNVEDVTLYTLRHTKGTELYYLTQKGVLSTKLAAEFMGHSEAVFLHNYAHIDREIENLETLRAVTNL